jgi:hypothetical protein
MHYQIESGWPHIQLQTGYAPNIMIGLGAFYFYFDKKMSLYLWRQIQILQWSLLLALVFLENK